MCTRSSLRTTLRCLHNIVIVWHRETIPIFIMSERFRGIFFSQGYFTGFIGGKYKMRKNVDLTQGSALKQILLFSLPLLLGNVFQQLYNTVDSMIVGNFVGNEALAAVGASGPIINTLISFLMGLSVGTGIIISQSFGAGNIERLQKAVNTIITVIVILSICIAIAGIPLSTTLLKFVQTPDNVLEQGTIYLQITSRVLSFLCSAILWAVFFRESVIRFLHLSSLRFPV